MIYIPDDPIKEILSFCNDCDLFIISHVCHRFKSLINKSKIKHRNLMTCCLGYDNVELYKYLLPFSYYFKDLPYICSRLGSINILKWCRQNRPNFYLNMYCYIEAITNNQDEVFKWLAKNNCHWDSSILMCLASQGNLPLIKWAVRHGCPWDEHLCCNAAENGHLNIIKWVRKGNCPWNQWTFVFSINYYHKQEDTTKAMEMMQWLLNNGCPLSEELCTICCSKGGKCFDLLKWFRSHNVPWNKRLCLEVAADHDHQEIVDWLHSQD